MGARVVCAMPITSARSLALANSAHSGFLEARGRTGCAACCDNTASLPGRSTHPGLRMWTTGSVSVWLAERSAAQLAAQLEVLQRLEIFLFSSLAEIFSTARTIQGCAAASAQLVGKLAAQRAAKRR